MKKKTDEIDDYCQIVTDNYKNLILDIIGV